MINLNQRIFESFEKEIIFEIAPKRNCQWCEVCTVQAKRLARQQ